MLDGQLFLFLGLILHNLRQLLGVVFQGPLESKMTDTMTAALAQ